MNTYIVMNENGEVILADTISKVKENLEIASNPELLEVADALCKERNAASIDDDRHTMTLIDEFIPEVIQAYTAESRRQCFKHCIDSGDPMMTAIRTLQFDAIRTKLTKNKEEGTEIMTIEPTKKPIDLLRLQDKAGRCIGKSEKWHFMIEKFNLLLTCKVACSIGADPTEIHSSIYMSEVAKDIRLGKSPVSKSNLRRTLGAIIAAMIGDEYAEKVLSCDVNYLLTIYTKKGNRETKTVKVADAKFLTMYIAEIANEMVLRAEGSAEGYKTDYKKKKVK